MSDSSSPPVINPPNGSRFPKRAAMLSLLCPLLAIFILLVLLGFAVHGKAPRTMFIFSAFLILPFAGIGLGIAALAMAKSEQRKGVLGKAIAGISINGLFLVLMVVIPLLLSSILGNKYPVTPQGRLARAAKLLANASDASQRFYALNDAAKESFNIGKIEDAKKYATELLQLSSQFRGDWNYGNAVQDGNLVLGRIAVREGRIEDAKGYLLAAGKSPGSPQLDSFGPNLSLAKDLLEKGQRDTVLNYFELCRKFWKMDYGKLNQWSREVKAGTIPDFGANLVY
jgi:tetratricopeptide (TPR) repeat protein